MAAIDDIRESDLGHTLVAHLNEKLGGDQDFVFEAFQGGGLAFNEIVAGIGVQSTYVDAVAESIDSARFVAFPWVVKGGFSGPVNGIATSGETIVFEGVSLFLTDQGTEPIDTVFDRLAVFGALGIPVVLRGVNA